MSENDYAHSQGDSDNRILFPDFTELWKTLYFKTENAFADAFKEFVSTETFTSILNQSLGQHLSMEKVLRNSVDKYFEITDIPSKKDIARIAELVISVEEKVDNLDYQLVDNLNKIAASFSKMVEVMEENKKNILDLTEAIDDIQKITANMNKQIGVINKDLKPNKRKDTGKNTVNGKK